MTSHAAAGEIKRRPHGSTGKGQREAVTPISARVLPSAGCDWHPPAVSKHGGSAELLALPMNRRTQRASRGPPHKDNAKSHLMGLARIKDL